MPLLASERAQIRLYLGYSATYLEEDAGNRGLENAMDVLDTQAAELALVQAPLTATPPGILARLNDLEAKLLQAHRRKKVSKADDVVMNARELCDLRSEMQRAKVDLANLLGVAIRGASSWSGSNYVGAL